MKPRTATTATSEIKNSDIIKEYVLPCLLDSETSQRSKLLFSADSQSLRFQKLSERCCPGAHRGSRGRTQRHPFLSISTGIGIGIKHFGDGIHFAAVHAAYNVFDNQGDLIETDLAFEKRRHGNFI